MTTKQPLWMELWIEDLSNPPYYLLILQAYVDGSFEIFDPQEGRKVVESFTSYDEARCWLNEDEFTHAGLRLLNHPTGGHVDPANAPYERLLNFLVQLEERKISYRLEHNRPGAIMVLIATPGSRWEVEYFATGDVEVERFVSKGVVGDQAADEVINSLLHG